LITKSAIATFLVLMVLGVGRAEASSIYLVGALVYESAADGSNSVVPYYQYSTNTSTGHLALNINGTGIPISFLLSPGDNVFTFDVPLSFPIDIVGLELFFNDTGISYNPAYDPGVGIPGDLAAYTIAGSSTFAIPSAGTNVQSYNTTDFAVNTALYSGASAFTVGNMRVSLLDFSATSTPAGSFTLRVEPVPEPATFTLLGLGLAGVGVRRWRQRTAK
jgi:hypothetical protein